MPAIASLHQALQLLDVTFVPQGTKVPPLGHALAQTHLQVQLRKLYGCAEPEPQSPKLFSSPALCIAVCWPLVRCGL